MARFIDLALGCLVAAGSVGCGQPADPDPAATPDAESTPLPPDAPPPTVDAAPLPPQTARLRIVKQQD